MRRLLFIFASIVSLLLGAASVALWVRSGRVTDMVGLNLRHSSATVFSSQGDLLLFFAGLPDPMPAGRSWVHRTIEPTSLKDFVVGFMRFELHPHGAAGFYAITGPHEWGLLFPDWVLVCGMLILPAFCLVAPFIRRRHRGKRGQCLSCGYDLTGNASGVCPECGIAPSKLGRGG